jgi:steroid delta-isomerase-like uncharacterized protein
MLSPATNTVSGIDAAQSFFTAYNAHDVDKMLAGFSEDAQLRYVPMGRQGEGRVRTVGKTIWSGLLQTFPDLHVSVQRIFGDARNVAAEVIIGGTQQKDFLQIPNRGKHYELPHAFVLRMNEKGQISEVTAYWDNASFFSQLGKTTLQ